MDHKDKNKLIIKIIKQCFEVPPEEKAAALLYFEDIREVDMWGIWDEISSDVLLKVKNALRDLERKINEKRR